MHLYLRPSPRSLILVPTGPHDSRSNRRTDGKQYNGPNDLALILSATALPPSAPSNSSRGDPSPKLLDHDAPSSQVQAHVIPVSSLQDELPNLRRLTNSPSAGCIGLLSLGSDVFLCIVTLATQVGLLRPGETVMRVQQVQFYSFTSAAWDGYRSSGAAVSSRSLSSESSSSSSDSSVDTSGVHPCTDVRRLLSDGTFYYAHNNAFDISSRIGRRGVNGPVGTYNVA